MPNFDFTLEDIKGLLDDRFVEEREYTKGLFVAEREITKTMIQDSAEDVKSSIRDEFLSFWETNLLPALDDLHTEFGELRNDVKGMRRVLDRHSKDIMD